MTRVIKITLIWLALSLPAFAGDFEFASFDFPTCTVTVPTGLNIRAHVVGFCLDDSGTHGFMLNLHSHSWIKFDVSGSTFTSAGAINASEKIVGRWMDTLGVNHAYVRAKDGRFTSFDPTAPCVQSKLNTVAHGINDLGQIVGRCWDGNDNEHGFLRRQDGTFTIIDFPGAATTDAWTISNTGEILGDYSDSEGFVHGFILTAAGFSTIDFPSARHSALRYINERGDITGIYADSDVGPIHGFLLKNGVFRTVDFPGSIETDVVIINNRGLMLGDYYDANGNEHGFLAIECSPSRCHN